LFSRLSLQDNICTIRCTDGYTTSVKIPEKITDKEFVNLVGTACDEHQIDGANSNTLFSEYRRLGIRYSNRQSIENDEQLHDLEAHTQAESIMELIDKNVKGIFLDQNATAHAAIRMEDHNEIIPVNSSKFKRYVAKLFWDRNHKVVSTETIKNAINIVQARAEYESETIPLSLRVAWKDDAIYYDLTDSKWHSVRISKDEWQLVRNTPVLFTRHNPLPQVEPLKPYVPDIMDKWIDSLNITNSSHKLLMKVYVISLFIPDIAHVMLDLFGEKGSAKSTLFLQIKNLVDPCRPSLLTLHNDRKEFIQQLTHYWLCYYDNIRHIPGWLSDEACRAITGVGNTKRELFTDDDDIVRQYKRCLGFNGINICLTQEDALDRSILIDLERITPDKRRTEAEVLARFEELKPMLLGFIFDTIVKALQIKPSINLTELPRMADFAVWGEAIARAMGYKENAFLAAYFDNIGRQNIEAIEAHPLGSAIAKLVHCWQPGHDSWEGSPQELLEQLEIIAPSLKIDTKSRNWPRTPNTLSRRLNQIKSNLLEGLNIKVIIDRRTTGEKANTAVIRIVKISPISPVAPTNEQLTLVPSNEPKGVMKN